MKLSKSITYHLLFIFSVIAGCQSVVAEEYKRPKVAESDPYKVSDILEVRGKHTILPKNSAIVVPETYKARFTTLAAGEFQRWPEFYRTNYSWLQTHEVTIEQAKGNEPLDPSTLKRLTQTGKVIVAVYKKNPISVLDYKDPQKTPKK